MLERIFKTDKIERREFLSGVSASGRERNDSTGAPTKLRATPKRTHSHPDPHWRTDNTRITRTLI